MRIIVTQAGKNAIKNLNEIETDENNYYNYDSSIKKNISTTKNQF